MNAYSKSLLLFVLNLLDAVLTLVWVRNGWASEGNDLMAYLLDIGNAPFLITKLLVGGGVAYVLYRWSELRLARRGLTFVLSLYMALMLVHAATGLSALGWRTPETVVAYVSYLPSGLLALIS